MNVASRDLCIELKKLSQWGETDFCWNGDHLTPAYWPEDMRSKDIDSNPAYDAGYLLRMLPDVSLWGGFNQKWGAMYKNDERIKQLGATPEDALCKLAIELFKKKVLKK
jgi:hypothetical protein